MPNLYEECRNKFEQLVSWYQENSENRNEDTTRLHLIDRIFLECLAWAVDDIVTEEAHNGQYADYTFSAPRRILIVEAKREGIHFEIPNNIDSLEYSLKTLMRDNTNLKAALEQVAGYCQERGVSIGSVCNGHQLVTFVATRNDGLPPLEGRALVFPSLEFMFKKFLDLWQALSKPEMRRDIC